MSAPNPAVMPANTGELAIDVRGLVKRFGDKTAVDGVDLQMPAGEVWGFLGPNGSGKTTTIRMICGLMAPSEGEGTCLGYDIATQAGAIKLATGYMTQKFSFWTDLTIRENLEFVARLYRMQNKRQRVGAYQTPTPTCGRIVRRLETATRAGSSHHAQSKALTA